MVQAIEGLRSLEIRWIVPGQTGTEIAGWFGRFPGEVFVRDDSYLLDPALRGLSVKLRAGRVLEVKVYLGSPGMLHIAGRATGSTESWRKWSFPEGLSGPEGFSGREGRGAADWTVVRKRRRISRFGLLGGRVVADIPPRAADTACTVELTDVRSGGEDWWSLGFEATGPAALLRRTLESTAAMVLEQPPPGGVELCLSQCQSYAEWLLRRRAVAVTGRHG